MASVLWLLVEVSRTPHATRTGIESLIGTTIVLTPGRSALALYTFMVVATLVPPLAVLPMIWSRESNGQQEHPSAHNTSRAVAAAVALAGFTLSAGIAGYAYESLNAEVRLSPSVISYRAGSQSARIAVADVRRMVLHWQQRRHAVEVVAPSGTLNIELGPYSPADQETLLTTLALYADLQRTPTREADGIVWRKLRAPPGAPRQPIVIPQ